MVLSSQTAQLKLENSAQTISRLSPVRYRAPWTNLKRWLANHHVVSEGTEGPPVSREAITLSGLLSAADHFRGHVGTRATDCSRIGI